MTKTVNILSAQLNPVVGDVAGNLARARAAHADARTRGADLIVFPELFLLGYPPEDLVLKPAAIEACQRALDTLAADTKTGPAIIIGLPWRQGNLLHNAVALLDEGRLFALRFKHDLPNYSVFDEKRVFAPGPMPEIVKWRGIKLALPVCEDIWLDAVPNDLIAQGAEMMISINGSPWRRTIELERQAAFARWYERWTGPKALIFVNQIGGQDELVFDGASFSFDSDGTECQRLPAFEESMDLACWTCSESGWHSDGAAQAKPVTGPQADWLAMCRGLGDYVSKNGFPGVVLGMSGGIDSAISAAIAVDALGPDKVWAVMLPSKYTSQDSLEDAKDCSQRLGIRYDIIDVEPAIASFGKILAPAFRGSESDATEENIQSRARAVVLMALSNKFGPMVLSTGNKSEMAVGYATLYGDMNGGFNALKDIYKTEVYELARWRNALREPIGLGPAGEVITSRIITKAPSAELRPDQSDQDSLPPYEILDAILYGLIEDEKAPRDLIAEGYDEPTVRRVENLLYRAEYKRRQAPPGVKIGPKNFGRDRRYPMTNRFRAD
ncbi:NAD+ synthase [uncultured Maricaulis sp.]|uniref:NAD+ synthase n=1 Tax=uncultured Maricaulis sp. TaxID=174710 RepID=UPI0030D98677|tara:strand:- start:64 stop:1725 length:1662 start_codon:yes stop_codon:yes gene_type:complete